MDTECEFDGCTNSAWRTLTYGEYKSVPNPAGGQITVEPTSVTYCKDSPLHGFEISSEISYSSH
jgi:hypothetical protein